MSLLKLLLITVPLGVLVIGGSLWGIPAYKIYTAEQEGKAILARAEFARRAQTEDAKAKLESAKYLNEAAEIIKSSLTPEYLAYLEIQMKEEVAGRNGSSVYFFGDNKPVPSVSAPKLK